MTLSVVSVADRCTFAVQK